MCACEAARLLLHSRKEPQHKLNLCLGQRVIRRLPRPLAPSLVVRSGRGRRLVSCPAGCGINAAFCLVRDLPKELSSPRASERASERRKHCGRRREMVGPQKRKNGRESEGRGNFVGALLLLSCSLPISSHLFPGQTFVLNAVPGRIVAETLRVCERWVRTLEVKSGKYK